MIWRSLGYDFEFGSGGIVAAVLGVQCHEADVAAFDRIGKHHCLLRGSFLERAFGNGFAPLLAIGAYVDLIVLYRASGVAVLTGQILDAFDRLGVAGVEVNPVGIGGDGDGIHGVPYRRGVAVDEVGAFAVVGFLTAGVDGFGGDGLDLGQ